MTLGTLRDQVIYPDGKEDQKKKGISDQVRGITSYIHRACPTQILCHFKHQIVWPNLKPSKPCHNFPGSGKKIAALLKYYAWLCDIVPPLSCQTLCQEQYG